MLEAQKMATHTHPHLKRTGGHFVVLSAALHRVDTATLPPKRVLDGQYSKLMRQRCEQVESEALNGPDKKWLGPSLLEWLYVLR